jgi:branched-chain amino acid transport system ATP-binding protein
VPETEVAMLEIKNLNVYYGAIQALKGINLKVEQKEIVTVLGANGAGKSTLLRAITGLVNVRGGEILFEQKGILRILPHQRVSQGIAMAPEGRGIFPNLTTRENLIIGAYPYRKERSSERTEAIMQRVFQHFPLLNDRLHQRAGNLSGGEQQMLSIGRALMSRPRLLLLDEPSMGLGPILVTEIFKLIPQIRDEGTTILLIEQNAKAALKVAERGYILDMGAIVHEGAAEQLSNSEAVQAAYLM